MPCSLFESSFEFESNRASTELCDKIKHMRLYFILKTFILRIPQSAETP